MEYTFDIQEITQDIAKVLRYSQGFGDVGMNGVPKIIKDWFDNKKFFINHMNGQLIYQVDKPISFELDAQGKQNKLEHFATQVESHFNNYSLSSFLYNIEIADFYNNLTSKEYKCRNNIVIPAHYKVVKAFKFFESNEDILKELQNEASRIIQENIVSGYLCFSVHPLDYLSLSENVHNWRSCHALDGEYRSGNLNYMVDNTTVICYLRAEKQAVLPHFPEDTLWNSKKWRMLLFFSKDRTMVFAGRQYPFSSEQGLELIRKEILPTLHLGSWTKWSNPSIDSLYDEQRKTKIHFAKMIPIGNELKKFSDVVFDGAETYQFDDLLRSSVYDPVWSYREKGTYWDSEGTGCSDGDQTKVEVGKYCICPVCGQGTVSYTDIMCCPVCAKNNNFDDENYYECEICGSMTFCDDMYFLEHSGLRVCPDCYRRETVRCQECGLRDTPELVKYHDGDTRCLCPNCWDMAQHHNEIENLQIFF